MRYLFLLSALFGVYVSEAQYNSSIRSARPSLSMGTFTVGKGVLQFQQGINYIRASKDEVLNPASGAAFDAHFTYEALSWQNVIRYGICEKLEISAVINYNWLSNIISAPNSSDPGIKDHTTRSQDFKNLEIGGRYNILDGSNKAGLAWAVQLRADVNDWAFNQASGPQLKLGTAVAKSFYHIHSVRLNFGVNTAFQNKDNLTYGVNYTLKPTSKLSFTLEYLSGQLINELSYRTSTYLNAGVAYLLNDNIKLDVHGGKVYRINSMYEDGFFAGVGISWRIKTN